MIIKRQSDQSEKNHREDDWTAEKMILEKTILLERK